MIKKSVIREGDGVNMPIVGQNVKVFYKMKLEETGKVIDTTKDDPITFKVGVGQVLRGIDELCMSMTVGEECTAVISGDLGYGQMGCPPAVPPNAPLLIELNLVEIV